MAFINNFVYLEGFVAGGFERKGENGPAVGQISIGARQKDKASGEYKTVYKFIDVKGWGEARDRMAGISDGERVLINGQLDREEWQDKETQKTRYKLVVLINTISTLPKTGDGPTGFDTRKEKSASQEWDW